MAIHVSGAAQNVALVQGVSLEILDSEITAVGQDTTGIQGSQISGPASDLTLERSHVSAEMAFDEDFLRMPVSHVRLVDSHISGRVFFDPEDSLLEIVGSEIVGNVAACNDGVRVVITGSSIKGDVKAEAHSAAPRQIMSHRYECGTATCCWRSARPYLHGLSVHGELVLESTTASVLRSYIINSATTAPAISFASARVQLEQTFVQGRKLS